MKLLDLFACPKCGLYTWSCQCGYVIAAIAIAAIAAGYGAYASSEAQQQQADMQKKNARYAALAEKEAGEARARSIQYNADKMKKQMLSREAGAGVEIGQGSLLEDEAQFAYDTQVAKDYAKYPHELAGARDEYTGDLFGFQKKQLQSNEASSIAIASGGAAASSLASSGAARRNVGSSSDGYELD
jgi:hypothetical protein